MSPDVRDRDAGLAPATRRMPFTERPMPPPAAWGRLDNEAPLPTYLGVVGPEAAALPDDSHEA